MDSIFYSNWREDELLADTGAVFDYHYDEDYLNFHGPTCPIQQGPLDQCSYCFSIDQNAGGHETARPRRDTMYGLQDEPQQTWEDIVAGTSPSDLINTMTYRMSHGLVQQPQETSSQPAPSQARAARVSHLDLQLQARDTPAQQPQDSLCGPWGSARRAHSLLDEGAVSAQESRSQSAQTDFARYVSYMYPESAPAPQETRSDSSSSPQDSALQFDYAAPVYYRMGLASPPFSRTYLQHHVSHARRRDTPESTAPSSSQGDLERLWEHHLTGQARDPHSVDRLGDDAPAADPPDTPMAHDANELVVPQPAVSPTLSTASTLSTTSSTRPAQGPKRARHSPSPILSTASSSRPVQQPRRTGRQLLDGAFKCPKCDCAFDKRANMALHERRVHMEHSDRPWPCDEPGCDKRFLYRKDLLRHRKLHKPDKPVTCPHCNKTWVVFRADNFRRHMQSKHADQLAVTTSDSGVGMSRQASLLSSSADYRIPSRASSSSEDSYDDPLEDLQKLAAQSLEPA